MIARKSAKKSSPDAVDERLERLSTQRDAVALIRARRRAAETAAAGLDDAVRDARRAGVSWHGIGVVTDLTAEGARRRWHERPPGTERRRGLPDRRARPAPGSGSASRPRPN